MVIVDDKWNTDNYNYCEEHDQYYQKYCVSCVIHDYVESKENKNET